MSPLNYLGSAPGPGLNMPSGMPGSGAPEDPTLSAAAAQSMMAPPQLSAPMGMPPAAGAAPGLMGPGGVGMVDPAGRQYEAITQEDGSVLLHLKNPDGSKGPAVKIIPPIKPRNPGA